MNVSFEEFFEAVWNHAPYPWQSELSRVVRDEGWPRVLDLPTGSGKTAVLDIALHHLAFEGGHTAPRRMMMVVDRRVIVDQVGVRALRLLNAIRVAEVSGPEQAPGPNHTLQEVRKALRSIVGEGSPLLHVEVLRGGVVRRDAWAAYPHVPVLAGSTVDQVGSRLFFRGYGVSDRMQPVHAGLLGCDTLLFLDEVHLARPFAEVLEQLEGLRERAGMGEVPRRFQVVQLSATPGRSMVAAPVGEHSYLPGQNSAADTDRLPTPRRRSVFRLLDEDRADQRLARVLRAPKPAALELLEVKARSAEGVKRREMAARAARHAREMVREGRQAIAVVVNRVDTARRTWALLQDKAFDTVLITGRMRPLDQQMAITGVESRVASGRKSDLDAKPIVVVATQCIEAGADYDFDGLVTECASLDALRQRFGRLDRRGEYAERVRSRRDDSPTQTELSLVEVTLSDTEVEVNSSSLTARAVILMRSDYLGTVIDPVYGSALPRTWTWLMESAENGVVDFGIESIQPALDAAGEEVEDLLAPRRPTPVLLPAYVDQWAQTNPKPHADPDVSLFLHGIPEDARSVLADVQVVWRADIDETDLISGPSHQANREPRKLFEHLSMVPPGSLEMLSLPVWTVRQWLSGDQAHGDDTDIADIEGITGLDDKNSKPSRRAVIWRGKERSEIVGAADIPPGSTVIVPESYGGIGIHGTFDPEARFELAASVSEAPIYDLGDAVQLRQRGNPTLRLDPRVLRRLVDPGFVDLLPDLSDEEVEIIPALREALDAIIGQDKSELPRWFIEIFDAIGSRPRFVTSPRGGWLVLGRRASPNMISNTVASLPPRSASVATDTGPLDPIGSEEEEDESFLGALTSALLPDHLAGVGELVERFAERAHLPAHITASLKWAGHLHDVGKVDPRFQLWLHGGDEVAARFGQLLAKSTIPWQDAVARREARRRARYPSGQRHELVSLDMIERSAALRKHIEDDGADWDLVLHLIASHHGWCRPLAPVLELPAEDGDPVLFSLNGMRLEGSTAHERDRLGSGIAERFWKLNRRYGWHELAYIEAFLRLADHRRSAWETEQ